MTLHSPVRLLRATLFGSTLHTNALYIVLTHVAVASLGALYWSVAARFYPVAEVGIAAGAIFAANLVAALSTLGLDYGIVRFLPTAEHGAPVLTSALLLTGAVALATGAVALWEIDRWSPALLPVRQNPAFSAAFISLVLFAALTNLLNAVFVSRRKGYLVLALAAPLAGVRFVLAGAFIALQSAVALVSAWSAGFCVASLVGLILLRKRVEQLPAEVPTRTPRTLGHILRYSFANYAASLMWSAPGFLLPVVIINVAGPVSNAYFSATFGIAGLLAMIPLATSQSLLAEGSHREDSLSQYAPASLRLSLLLLTPLVALVVISSDRILGLLYGVEYAKHGTRLLQLLALSIIPMTITSTYLSVLRVQKDMVRVLLLMLLLASTSIVAALILTPRIGLVGGGLGWMTGQVAAAGIVLIVGGLRSKTSPDAPRP